MEIILDFDIWPFRRMVDSVVRDQVPFALANALNDVAFQARQKLIDQLPEHFTVRSNWTERGMRVEKATKRQRRAVVGSTRAYMRSQALGGVERPQSGRDIPVPMAARPTPESRTTRGKWPGAMLKKKGYFVARTQSGKLGVWKRRGKKRLPIKLMWAFVTRVEIDERWPLAREVAAVVRDEWKKAAEKHLRRAIQSARRR